MKTFRASHPASDDHVSAAVPGGLPAFPRPENRKGKKRQRELNPHFRHGKTAGYRYIMSALSGNRVVKDHNANDQIPMTNVQYRLLGHWSFGLGHFFLW